MGSRCGQLRTTYTKNGIPKYEIEIWHDELNKYKLVKGDSPEVVHQKISAEMAQWGKVWEKKEAAEQRTRTIQEKKRIAAERTEKAQKALRYLENILAHALGVDNTIDWETLKKRSDYPEPKPRPHLPRKPEISDEKYQVKLGILDRIFRSRRFAKEYKAQALYKADITEYKKKIVVVKKEYEVAALNWLKQRQEYLKRRDKYNKAIDRKKEKYLAGECEAVLEYCDMVLKNSKYPDYFPKSYELDYNPENRLLVVDYELPSPGRIVTLSEVKYVQSRDELIENHISKAQLNKLYDSILYQISIRTIHELYEVDKIDALKSIVFNGYVRSVDPATGQETFGCVLSLQANKDEFELINLKRIEPKACFRKLRGVGSSKLHSITPVAPIIHIDRSDKRFVASYGVVDSLQEGENLAAMDWEDFEHLIRELFEKEFTADGGEVKVTRASRDGGIDAVAFDPDPIRGGKIVIQAKRYTNTVGVSAVRDLYGTVVNEGANKGILVTTSNYGPDAYEFAKGKPLSLLDGSNLLHLLQRHGYKAKIDLNEAKKILDERGRD